MGLKCFQDFIGKGGMEFRGNPEPPLGQPDGARRIALDRQRTDLRDGDVPLAEKDRLPFGKSLEVLGKVGLGVVYVDSNHGSILA